MGIQHVQGKKAEAIALALLEQRGWTLLNQNWCCRFGELDLVLVKPGRLLVVEVKGRSSRGMDDFGVAATNRRKRRCLARALSCWRMEHPRYQNHLLQVVLALVRLRSVVPLVQWKTMDRLD